MGDRGAGLLAAVGHQLVTDVVGREVFTQPPSGLVRRSEVTVPIARSGTITDETFYDAATSGDTYFLPRWRVTQPPGGLPQITLQQSPSGWTLTVHLSGYAAPAISDQLGSATPIACDYGCLVRYNLTASAGAGSGAVLRELAATEVTGNGLELTATFSGADTAELNQLYSAMTEDEHGTVVIVRRTLVAAVEVPQGDGGRPFPGNIILPPIIRNPPVPVRPRPFPVERPVQPVDPRPPGEVVQPVDDRLFVVDLVRLGAVLRAGTLRVGAFEDEAPAPTATPAPFDNTAIHRFGDFNDVVEFRRRGIDDFVDRRIDWGNGEVDPEPVYDERAVELDVSESFVYPPALYPSIYAGVTASSGSFALRRVEVIFQEQTYPYYQDVGAAATFYYLPDAFRLGRRAGAPHVLMLDVDASDTDGTVENMKIRFGFAAIPVISPARLTEAATALRVHAPGPYPPGIDGPQLMPLVVSSSALKLSLLLAGDGDPAGSGAILSLRNGIVSSETLTVPQFSTVYNALFGGIALVSGTLEVMLDAAGATSDTVPVELRVGDAWGPLVDVVNYRAEGDSVPVTILNTIESPVVIESVDAALQRGDGALAPSPATLASGTFPVTLLPGNDVSLRVDGPAPDGDGPLQALVKPAVSVQPDPVAVWLSVFTHVAPMPLKKVVTVRVPADIFAERPGPNGHPALKGVTVEFEAGVAAPFDPTNMPEGGSPFLTKTVEVPVGLEGYVIAGVAPGSYKYRVSAITATNDVVREAMPRISNIDILDVTLPSFAETPPPGP